MQWIVNTRCLVFEQKGIIICSISCIKHDWLKWVVIPILDSRDVPLCENNALESRVDWNDKIDMLILMAVNDNIVLYKRRQFFITFQSWFSFVELNMYRWMILTWGEGVLKIDRMCGPKMEPESYSYSTVQFFEFLIPLQCVCSNTVKS